MRQFAYIRVSTKDQSIERQLAALEPYKIPPDHIFIDYQSGKDFQRPAYQELMRKLRPGDLLMIKSIDRLGRNYDEILAQWQYITKIIKVDIQVLDMELLDTRSKSGTLTGTLIADTVLQIGLCGADRTGVYPAAAGRGDCLGQGQWTPSGEDTDSASGTV